MAYDKKFREKVLQYIDRGHTIKQAREVFGISTYSIKKWRKLRRQTGDVVDSQRKDWHKKLDPVKLVAYYENTPDSYLSEAAEHFGCSINAIFKAKKRLGITRKKN